MLQKNYEEIWKDIPGYEGLYQVSNLGRVKSLDRTIIIKNKFSKYKRHYEEKITKIDNASISRCCYNKQEMAGGYKWRFSNE